MTAQRGSEPAAPFPSITGYRFRARLGSGGMATVYLATQESLDRPVAIKVMDRDALEDETARQRFENEARTIARLSHPGIVGIHEVGRTDDARMYYIMPYLPNGDLTQHDFGHDDARVADVLAGLLAALQYAHARGIVHRDVKQANVLFDADDRPLLTDFGIALSRRDDSRITTDGLSVGSSGYMAPEQARGEAVDGRADLYGVGVLAYELLAGKLPFEAPDALGLALMHAQDPVPRLPPEKRHWQPLIDRAMAKSPANRFDSALQMREALTPIRRRGAIEGSRNAAASAMRGPTWRRHALLVGALLLVIAAIAWLRPGSNEPKAAATPALQTVPSGAVAAFPGPASAGSASLAVPAGASHPSAAPGQAPAASTRAVVPAASGTASAQPPAQAKPAAQARRAPAKAKPKKRGFFSRLFHRR